MHVHKHKSIIRKAKEKSIGKHDKINASFQTRLYYLCYYFMLSTPCPLIQTNETNIKTTSENHMTSTRTTSEKHRDSIGNTLAKYTKTKEPTKSIRKAQATQVKNIRNILKL